MFPSSKLELTCCTFSANPHLVDRPSVVPNFKKVIADRTACFVLCAAAFRPFDNCSKLHSWKFVGRECVAHLIYVILEINMRESLHIRTWAYIKKKIFFFSK